MFEVQFEKEPEAEPVTEIKPGSTPEPVVSQKETTAKIQNIANQIGLKFPLNSNIPINDEFDSNF